MKCIFAEKNASRYEICNTQICPVQDLQDCIFGEWSLWGGCSQACNGSPVSEEEEEEEEDAP